MNGKNFNPRMQKLQKKNPYHNATGDEMTFQEIGDEIGVSWETARMTYYKALESFRRNWMKMYGEPPPMDIDDEVIRAWPTERR